MVSPFGWILYQTHTLVFSFSFVFSLTPTKYSLSKTILLALSPCLLIITIGFIFIDAYLELESIKSSLLFILKYTLFAVFCLLFACIRQARTLFIVLMSTNIVIPGYIAGMLVFMVTELEYAFLLSSGFVNAFVSILLVQYVKRSNACYHGTTQISWPKLCLIPLSFIFLQQSIFPIENVSSFDLQRLPAAIAVLVSLLTSYALIDRCMKSQSSKAILQARQDSMSNFERYLQQENKLINDTYLKIIRFRHDMPHFLNMIHSAIRGNRLDEAHSILANLPIPDTVNNVARASNDNLLNSVLSVAEYKARHEKVALHMRIAMPTDLDISRIEFAAVVGNLADNAIAAASKTSLRKASIKIGTVNSSVFIRVDNSFETKLLLDPISGLPISKKGDLHGWGLLNVDDFVKRNKGILDFQHKDQTVTARLLIPLKNDSKRVP